MNFTIFKNAIMCFEIKKNKKNKINTVKTVQLISNVLIYSNI